MTGKSESLRTKTSTVYALVSRFLSVRSAEYASLDDRRLLEVTQSVPVPPGCIGSRGVVLAACVEGIYGIELSATLRLQARLTGTAPDGRLRTQSGREWLQTQSGEEWLWTQSGREQWLWTWTGREWLPRREWLQTWIGREWLQTQSGQEWRETLDAWPRVAADLERTRVAADSECTRVAANTLWSSTAINSVSVFLGPNGRILACSRSNQQVHHFPGIILAPSFPNDSANQGLA